MNRQSADFSVTAGSVHVSTHESFVAVERDGVPKHGSLQERTFEAKPERSLDEGVSVGSYRDPSIQIGSVHTHGSRYEAGSVHGQSSAGIKSETKHSLGAEKGLVDAFEKNESTHSVSSSVEVNDSKDIQTSALRSGPSPG